MAKATQHSFCNVAGSISAPRILETGCTDPEPHVFKIPIQEGLSDYEDQIMKIDFFCSAPELASYTLGASYNS